MPYDETAEQEDVVKAKTKKIRRKYKRDIDMIYYIARIIMSNPKDEEIILDTLKLNMTQLKMIVQAKSEISKHNFHGVVFHWIFMVLFFAVVYLQQHTDFAFVMNQAITNTLVTNDFSNIGSFGDLSNFIKNDFVPAFTQTSYYNGDPYDTSSQSLYLAGNNRVIGSIRFRQLRVRDDSCSISTKAKDITSFCYANSYTPGTKDTQPFGPPSDHTRYRYYSASESGSQTINSLEGGGYIVDIPLWPVNKITNVTDSLIADRWFDLPTRAVIITTNFFNVGLDNRIGVLYLIVQMDAAGTVSSSSIMDSFKADFYSSSTDFVRLVLELAFLGVFALLVFRKVKEVKQHYNRGGINEYLTENWQFIDISFFLLELLIIFMYISLLIEYAVNPVDFSSTTYIPTFERLAVISDAYFSIVSLALLFGVVRTFKFLLSNSRLSLMWSVLNDVRVDLCGLLISSFLLLLGFMLFGYIAFGSDLQEFNGVAQSIETGTMFVIGNPPDWDSMAEVNVVLGPLFIILFTVFIFIALMNMFIAILNKGYTYISSRPGDTIFKGFGQIFRTLPFGHNIANVAEGFMEQLDDEEDYEQPLQSGEYLPTSPDKEKKKKDGGDDEDGAGKDDEGSDKIDIDKLEIEGAGVGPSSSDPKKSKKVEEKIDLLFQEITEIHKLLNQILSDKKSS